MATPLWITEDEVAGLLTMPEAVEAIESAFRHQAAGEGSNQPRGRFFVPGGVLHHMAAALPGFPRAGAGVMGTKTYTSFGAAGTRFWVMLYSAETGDLLAVIEADRMGQIRTGAATGVAVRHMARADAGRAALLGTGWQAQAQAQALLVARPGLREVRAFGRDTERRLRFCRQMTDTLGIPVTPMHTVEAALKGAQIVVCATSAREPILRGEDLPAGVFVAAVGANRLTAREVDEETVARADIVAVDDIAQARVEAAELIFAHERRRFSWERAHPLAQIVAGRAPGRENDEQITLFKSLGIALEDIAVAALVHEKARSRGVGRPL
jgi:ornithine cyclodeaminase/alanine dehydrogenase-like protein (mu-crystallin family)